MQPWHYIVLVGAVVMVAAIIAPRRQQQNRSSEDTGQLEAAFGQFMESMEKDNEEIIALIAKSQTTSRQESEKQRRKQAELELQIAELQSAVESLSRQGAISGLTAAAAVPGAVGSEAAEAPAKEPNASVSAVQASEQESGEQSIKHRYADLFGLYAQGKSIEAIAKKLGMNKGEVQLIIQLARQEGAAHV